MINVLVTGSNGQLGKTLKQLSSKYSDKIEFTFATKQDLDITNNQEVSNFFSRTHYDY